MTRTRSMRSHSPVRTSGSRSFATPGSMPDVKADTPLRMHASWIGSTISFGALGGYTSGTSDVDRTFFPESRMRTMSSIASTGRRSPVELYDTASAFIASSSSASFVALMPMGATPAISPASMPAFSFECAHNPTSTSSGWLMIPRSA